MTFANRRQRDAISNQIRFRELSGGLVIAEITNSHATASISLQGAHMITFQPRSQEPVLWLSDTAKFSPGTPIRGGVPVCWPWFGPHGSNSLSPSHGYARTEMWDILETRALSDGTTLIRFGLTDTQLTRPMWPHPAIVLMEVVVGRSLSIELVTHNMGTHPFALEEALHAYFHISDVTRTSIRGLDGSDYLDKTDGLTRRRQLGDVAVAGEVDRVYLDTTSDCLIDDRGLNRTIRIAKVGSRSTVIWNPWKEKAAKMDDFESEGYRRMVCVESANAADNRVTVAPGESHRLAVVYSVEPLG